MSEIKFLSPVMGDLLLEGADGAMEDGRFWAEVLLAADCPRLWVNEIPASPTGAGRFAAKVPLDGLRCRVEARGEDGSARAITVWRLRNAEKTYRFTVDDCIRCFEDLNGRHYASIFENPFLGLFRRAHDECGSRVHLNLFYESADGGFNLSQMTDRYRGEFQRNADWLSMTFHARREFPNAPYRNASYEEIYRDCEECTREIARFAGPEALRRDTTLHFGACTVQGVRALRAFGFRALCGYLCFTPEGEPLVSYHLSPDQIAHATLREGWADAEEDVVFPKLDLVLNDPALTADRVEPFLDQLAARPHEGNLIQMVIHEQYFYPDYPLYEPDYGDRILTMARWMVRHGYRSASLTDMMREEAAGC